MRLWRSNGIARGQSPRSRGKLLSESHAGSFELGRPERFLDFVAIEEPVVVRVDRVEILAELSVRLATRDFPVAVHVESLNGPFAIGRGNEGAWRGRGSRLVGGPHSV